MHAFTTKTGIAVHLASRWEDLNMLANLLHTWPEPFDFIFKINMQQSLCVVKALQTELNSQHQRAIDEARKSGFNVYIFKAEIPGSMDFELEEVVGGIVGRVNIK
jgi:hypothetical protein